ncbi:DUF934 domain-containing protein [Oceaniserpentilla sp. 4NH20-0058]|uniref:DUF934 domain-containing protein n=1 Tax=Oceaniserpentilla sp. 4NH20-0058 TaxID=3127660 RepID=UPI00310355C7
MQNLINQTTILENPWLLVTDTDAPLPSGSILVDSKYWLENIDKLKARGDVSVFLNADADLELLKDHLNSFPVIAVNFPAFADGRGYSLARLLKERFGYEGEIRAIGDVLIDQLYFMKRCGFDTYLLKDGLDAQKALNYFSTFSDPYQLAYDLNTPLFRRKA